MSVPTNRLISDVLQQLPQATAFLKGRTARNPLNQQPSLVVEQIVGYGGLRNQGTHRERRTPSQFKQTHESYHALLRCQLSRSPSASTGDSQRIYKLLPFFRLGQSFYTMPPSDVGGLSVPGGTPNSGMNFHIVIWEPNRTSGPMGEAA